MDPGNGIRYAYQLQAKHNRLVNFKIIQSIDLERIEPETKQQYLVEGKNLIGKIC